MVAVNPLFLKIAASDGFEKSPRIVPGDYVFEVTRQLLNEGFKGSSFVAELKVVSATKTHDNEPNAVGTSVGFVQNFAKVMALGNVKLYLCGLTGAQMNELTVDVIAAACEKDQTKNVCLGQKITCSAFKGKPMTDGKGGFFTDIKWSHVPA